MSAPLYQIQRTLLQDHTDVAHYRYDLVNTLNGGVVATAFTSSPFVPQRLADRYSQINAVWALHKAKKPFGKKVRPSDHALVTWSDTVAAYDPVTSDYE